MERTNLEEPMSLEMAREGISEVILKYHSGGNLDDWDFCRLYVCRSTIFRNKAREASNSDERDKYSQRAEAAERLSSIYLTEFMSKNPGLLDGDGFI